MSEWAMSHNLIGANSFRETRSIFYPHHHPHAKPRFNFITSSHFISRNVYSTYYYSLFLLPNPPSLSSLSPSLSLTPSLSSSEQYTHYPLPQSLYSIRTKPILIIEYASTTNMRILWNTMFILYPITYNPMYTIHTWLNWFTSV